VSLQSAVWDEWGNLKARILQSSSERADFEKLRGGEGLWKITGYRNEKTWRAYICPRTEDVIKTGGRAELLLLRELARRGEATMTGLMAEGFTKEIIVETLNAVMRDRYVEKNGEQFRLTTVGVSILTDLLGRSEAGGSHSGGG
jgi:hypothetical protein